MQAAAKKTLFIDVRTRAEIAFVGIPENVDANIPFMFMSKDYAWNDKKKRFKMRKNKDFVFRVISRLKQKGLNKNSMVIVMCRSGGRSSMAADALTEAGFTNVVSVIDGFEGDRAKTGEHKGKRVVNGWKNSGLPWTEALDKSKMYLHEDLKKKDHKLKMLKKMDVDKDGIITQEEFAKHHREMFRNLDQDQSNSIDEQEIKKYKQERKLKKQKTESP